MFFIISANDDKMLFIGDTTRIYTMHLSDDKEWQQYDDNRLKLMSGGLLTSGKCLSRYKIKIKGVYIFTLEGWVLWAGIDQDYFELVSTTDDNYSIEVCFYTVQ